MSGQETQKRTHLYKGWPQPPPDERLAQIQIFLADEDYHRCLGFAQKLGEIEKYIAFLEKNGGKFDTKLLTHIKEMIDVHKGWIKRATQGPSTSYNFARYPHRNRLLGMVVERRKRKRITRMKAPRLSQNLVPGPALHLGMERAERPASPDPFLYTKQLAEIRRRQDAEAKQINDDGRSPVLKDPAATNFNGPYTASYSFTNADIMEQKNILTATVDKLQEAANLTPRRFIEEIIAIIARSMADAQDIALEGFESDLTNKDLQRLLTLAEPSWNAAVKRAVQDLSEDGSTQSAMFAQLMGLFNTDLWSNQQSDATLDAIFDRYKSDAEGELMTISDVEAFLVEMSETGRIAYDVDTRTVRKPVLDRHPEDGLPQELYRTIAQKLGHAVTHLGKLLDVKGSKGGTTFLRDISSIEAIKQRIEAKFPLPTIAPTPSQAQESSLTKKGAAKLLQTRIILEHHRNWEERQPNFQRLWAFGSSIENPKQFFALDRWPPELQTPARMKEIRESGPTIPSPKEVTEVEFPKPKKNETFFPGETIFPFGETPYQAALLAFEIDQAYKSQLDQPDAPATDLPPYSDPFALPAVDGSEMPALMEYCAKLGLGNGQSGHALGKRKRTASEEQAVAAAAATAAAAAAKPKSAPPAGGSITITTTEEEGAPLIEVVQPTLGFPPLPETMGGITIRVAESSIAAGGTTRRNRFRAPGAAGIGGIFAQRDREVAQPVKEIALLAEALGKDLGAGYGGGASEAPSSPQTEVVSSSGSGSGSGNRTSSGSGAGSGNGDGAGGSAGGQPPAKKQKSMTSSSKTSSK